MGQSSDRKSCRSTNDTFHLQPGMHALSHMQSHHALAIELFKAPIMDDGDEVSAARRPWQHDSIDHNTSYGGSEETIITQLMAFTESSWCQHLMDTQREHHRLQYRLSCLEDIWLTSTWHNCKANARNSSEMLSTNKGARQPGLKRVLAAWC